MDAKLKSLKVPELKEILSKASIPPGNAKKQDLINKILANPSAINQFHTLHPTSKPNVNPPTNDDLLAPPEEVDWTVEEVILAPSKSTQKQPPPSPPKPSSRSNQPPATVPKPATAPPPPAQFTSTETPTSIDDEEVAKRKARAARFNIDYVEPEKSTQQRQKKDRTPTIPPSENLDKLAARAERFGISMTKASRKRTTPAEQVDPEEQERRRKRAERFGQISDTKV